MAVQLERHLGQNAYVVGGALGVEGAPVYPALGGFGADGVGAPDWDGHAWVMIGAHIIDPSIFRAAYSADGPPRLARHVDLVFGPGKALFVDTWRHAAQLGFSYRPMHVFSADEVTHLMGGAYVLIQQSRS
jgi:hypothetical protein